MNCFERRLVQAIWRQSFYIRKIKFKEKGDLTNVKFMRKGVAGDWNRFLNEKTLSILRKSTVRL
jgi:hypothetical protein